MPRPDMLTDPERGRPPRVLEAEGRPRHLRDLAETIDADPLADDDDRTAIIAAAAATADRRLEARRWRETAHMHDVTHAPIVTVRDDGGEDIDASALVCHDCGRGLVSDEGTARVLLCPRLHGRRPMDRDPGHHVDAAIECGRPG